MTSRDFCFWLQGFFELAGVDSDGLTHEQVEIIQRHLSLMFVHEIDPSMGKQGEQDKLNQIHTGGLPDGAILRPSDDKLIRC